MSSRRVLESSTELHSCQEVKWNKKWVVYVFNVHCNHDFCVLGLIWAKIGLLEFWKNSLHLAWAVLCTFNTPPLSLPVTMNKPVNRIFQSSCGVLLSERTACQNTKKKEVCSPLTEREVTPNTVENSDDPSGSSTSQCWSAAWFMLTLSLFYIQYVFSLQLSFL